MDKQLKLSDYRSCLALILQRLAMLLRTQKLKDEFFKKKTPKLYDNVGRFAWCLESLEIASEGILIGSLSESELPELYLELKEINDSISKYFSNIKHT